jgi:hypothetical protein
MKYLILLGLLAVFAIWAVSFIGRSGKEMLQPIAYDHQKHVEENGMECLDCHQYAEEHARASIPNVEFCRDCHEEAISESENELVLLSFVTENRQIPWQQVYKVPDHAFFSHRRHVKLGELECVACHGDVAKLSASVSVPYVEVTMEWCLDCHETRGVSNDCAVCHR